MAASILEGDAESGATIMRVVREVDAGPIIGQVRTPIGPLDTTETLTGRISELGAELQPDLQSEFYRVRRWWLQALAWWAHRPRALALL